MKAELLIKPFSHAEEIIVEDQNDKIDFQDYQEEICSTFSGINLYKVTEEYYEDENCPKELVAIIYGRYFDIFYAQNNGVSLYDVFDMPDGDSASLIPYLLDEDGEIKDEYYSLFNNAYYLDRIYVEEKFRGQGYASFLLKNLPEILMYLVKIEYGIIIVQAQPFDTVDGESIMDYKNKERTERLIKLYEKNGFSRIGNSNYLIYTNG